MWRRSTGPRRRRRRLRARRTASFRLSGRRARSSWAISSRFACMTSRSSGRGLRTDLASASAPRSSTSRSRISRSISAFSCSMRAATSSWARRAESSSSAADPLEQSLLKGLELEIAQRSIEVVRPADGAPGLHAGVARDGLTRPSAQRVEVAVAQRAKEQLGQLRGAHRPATALSARTRPVRRRPRPRCICSVSGAHRRGSPRRSPRSGSRSRRQRRCRRPAGGRRLSPTSPRASRAAANGRERSMTSTARAASTCSLIDTGMPAARSSPMKSPSRLSNGPRASEQLLRGSFDVGLVLEQDVERRGGVLVADLLAPEHDERARPVEGL